MTSSQETLGQFQPSLVGNMIVRWKFRFGQFWSSKIFFSWTTGRNAL